MALPVLELRRLLCTKYGLDEWESGESVSRRTDPGRTEAGEPAEPTPREAGVCLLVVNGYAVSWTRKSDGGWAMSESSKLHKIHVKRNLMSGFNAFDASRVSSRRTDGWLTSSPERLDVVPKLQSVPPHRSALTSPQRGGGEEGVASTR